MRHNRFTFWLFVAVILVLGFDKLSLNASAADSNPHATVTETIPVGVKAAACARTVEQFVFALNTVLTENPRSILRYHAVLARYLFLKNGIPNLPSPSPDAFAEGCRIDEVVQIAKRSKFFYEADGPPRYKDYVIEFRNATAKVAFSIERTTGNIIDPNAKWIAVYP